MIRLTVGLLAATVVLCVASGCSGESEEPAPKEKPMATRLEEADQIFRNRQYERAGSMFESLADDALAAGDDSVYVEAAAMRARSYLIQGNAAEGRPWLSLAAEKADPAEPRAWSRYLGVRGRFEWEDGDNTKATETFRTMFDYCGEHGLYDRAVDAAHMIALTGDPEEKFEWAMRGIDMAEKGNMIGWLGPLWNNLGWDYVDAGRYEEALEALEKAREYHYMGTADIPKLIADYSVAHVLRLKGDLDLAREAMEDVFKRAEGLKQEGNPDALEWMGLSRWELGEITVARGEAGLGLGMMQKALGELEEAGMPTWDAEDWEKRKARVAELETR
jgi:tetratricopeptide (TPR) repeat protein